MQIRKLQYLFNHAVNNVHSKIANKFYLATHVTDC
jgi:hypothetical protein